MGESLKYVEREVKCDICGSEDRKHIRSKHVAGRERLIKDGDKIFHQNDVMCMQCGLVYKNPMIDEEHQLFFYKNDYLELFSPSLVQGIPKAELLHRAIDCIYMMEWLNKNDIKINNLRVLNVGSGLGVQSHFFESYGAEVTSVEPMDRSADIAKKLFGIESVRESFNAYETDDKFDVIVLQNSLEHFYSPRMTMEKASRLLSEGGFVLVEITDVFHPYPGITVNGWLSSAHNYSFSENTIWQLCSKSGFKITHCDHGGDKAKLLIRAVPGNMDVTCDDPELVYRKLFDLFHEIDEGNIKFQQYNKELSEGRDVYAIGKEIYDNTSYITNTYLVTLGNSFISSGRIDALEKLISACQYRDNGHYNSNAGPGIYDYYKALVARKNGDMILYKKYLEKAKAGFPPIDKYNVINSLIMNGMISESVLRSEMSWNVKKLLEKV